MKLHKIKHKIASKIILNLYFNSWRIFIYKNIYKYDIGKNVKIGRSLINSDRGQYINTYLSGSKYI